jgi:hypothetical protein
MHHVLAAKRHMKARNLQQWLRGDKIKALSCRHLSRIQHPQSVAHEVSSSVMTKHAKVDMEIHHASILARPG